MKKNFSLILTIGLVFLLSLAFAVPASAAETKKIKLRLAAVFPPPAQSLGSYGVKLWMDEVTKKTDGQVTFDTFWGGALGKPAEHLTLVERGVADLVLTHRWYTPGKLPLGQFEYVFPFGPVDPLIVTKGKRQVYEEFPDFRKNLAKHNALLIMNTSACAYQFLSKTPLRNLDDFNGKKVALIGRYFGRWVEPTGAIPVVAPAADRYTMLQTGVVDVDLLPLDLFASYKIQEQAPILTEVNLLTANWPDLLMNLERFGKLPKSVQTIFIETGKEIELRMGERDINEWTKKVLEEFKKQNVTINKFPESERDKWASMVADIPAEWAKEVTGQGYPGWEIVHRYQEITTQLGYKWPRKWGVKK